MIESNVMILTNQQYAIINNRLENTLSKVKKSIRLGNGFPTGREVFGWFSEMLPFEVRVDAPPRYFIDRKKNRFEVLFFFEGEQFYLYLQYCEQEYRGNKYLDFCGDSIRLSRLDKGDYMDQQLIEYLQIKYHIRI